MRRHLSKKNNLNTLATLTHNGHEFLQISDTAKLLGVSIDTIRRWDKARVLKSHRLDGKNRYFLLQEIRALQERKPLSVSEVALRLGISVSTLRRLEKRGHLIGQRNNRNERFYSQAQVESYLSNKSRINNFDLKEITVDSTLDQEKPTTKSQENEISEIPFPTFESSFEDPPAGEAGDKPQIKTVIEEVEEVEPDQQLELKKYQAVFAKKLLSLRVSFYQIVRQIPIVILQYKRSIVFGSLVLIIPLATFVFIVSKGIKIDHFSAQKFVEQKASDGSVLAETSRKLIGNISFNVPAIFNEKVLLNDTLLVEGLATFSANITAPNVIYSIASGSGILIGPGQNPSITNTGVLTLGGSNGDITLGTGLKMSDRVLSNSDTGSSQKIFKTVKLGSDSVSAGSNTDTLEFSAGTGVSLSLDTSNKKLTISGSSGALGWTDDGTVVRLTTSTDSVGVGTTSPSSKFDILSTSEQFRLAYDSSNYTSFTVSSGGDLTLNPTGGDIIFSDADVLNIGGSGSDTAYNTIGDSTTGASSGVDSDDDLYIEGSLEVDGAFILGSDSITDITGNGALAVSSSSLIVDVTVSGAVSGETSAASGLAVNSDGLGLLRGCANGEILKWNSTTNVWACGSDAGASGTGIATIKENDTNVVTSATTIDFLGNDFTVTNSPAGEGNVSIDYTNSAIARKNANETVSGNWTFSSATPIALSSTSPAISIGNTGSLTITDGTNTLLTLADAGTSGNLSSINNLTAAGTITFSGLSTAGIVLNSAAGVLSTEATLATSRGGLGGNVTAAGAGEIVYSTGTTTYDNLAAGTANQILASGGAAAPAWTNIASLLTAGAGITISGTTNATITSSLGTSVDLTSEVTGVLPIANGGTNKALTLAAGAVVWTDADSFEVTAAGTSGQCLTSNGTAAPSWATCTSSSLTPFTTTAGVITKTDIGDRLSLRYGDAGDVQLEVQNTTTATIPTADAVQIDLSGGTTGIITDGVDALSIAAEFGNGTTNTNAGLHLDIDPVNTPSGDETFYGITIDALTAATSATETAINIGANWDTVLNSANLDISGAGAITGATGITSSGTITLSGLSTAGPVITNGSGVLSSEAQLAVARGGTNSTATPTAGGITYGTGTAYAFTSAGTSGQAILSGGAGSPTFTTGTLTLAGNFATSGANDLTLTTTASTNVTLPTTGTLATLAGTETLSNKTLTAPRFADLGFIADANGNELIILDTVASAVNEITIANAATGNGPTIIASGETNVPLTINSKATGALTLDSGTTGTVNLGTGNNAKTIAIGTGTAGNTINIGTNNTTLDTISIGSALDDVAITGDEWSITSAGLITSGQDKTTPTANTAGSIKLISAGDNAFSTTITTGTQTQDITYTLPLDDGAASTVLTSNGSGSLSWQTLGGLGSGGDITAVGSMTTGDAFADSTADDDWLGLGAAAGRIEFDDLATDEVNILASNVGIGTQTPSALLNLVPTTAAALTIDQFGTAAGQTGELRFMEGGASSTQYTAFKAPDSLTTNVTYVLPNHDTSVPTADMVITWQSGNVLQWKSIAGVGAGGDITDVGSMTTGAAFAGAAADDDCLGLTNDCVSGTAARIEFDDQTIDEINFLSANIGIGTSTPTSQLQLGGVATTKAAPTTTGAWLGVTAATLTDNSTAISGTASTGTFNAFGIPTYAASNTGVTVTDAANVYIAGAVAAGTNTTLTNSYALWVDAGSSRFDTAQTVASATTATLNAHNIPADTTTITGATGITTSTGFNLVNIGIPTYSAASALTITNAATTYIAGAPTGAGAGPATITNAYSLWADAGNVRFDGQIIAGSANEVLTLSTGKIDADAITLTTSGGAGSTFSNSGLEVVSDGLTLLKGCSNNQVLKWDDTTDVRWECADDTSGVSGIVTVQENDVTVGSSTGTLDFLGADFDVSESPAGEDNIQIDYTNFGSDSLRTTLNIGDVADIRTIEIGGVTNDGTNTIRIATNGTTNADVISIGNSNASTTIALTGGDDWNISAAGAANFVSIGATTRGTGAFTTLDGNGNITLGDAAADTVTVNGTTTFNTDVNFTLADTENIAITNTVTGTNALDLITATLTNQTTLGTQRGLVLTNADDATNATTESLIALDNAETTANLLTDYLIITKATTGPDTTTDAIDVSDADLGNALNVGPNPITGTSYTINATTALTIGDNTPTVAVNSSDWDISTTGAITNATYEGLTISTTTGTLTVANGSTLVTSGANSLTLTTTAATNATFPTGTITLADLGTAQTFTALKTFGAGATITTGQTLTVNGDGFTDLTGTGLTISTGALQTTLGTSVTLTSEVDGVLPIANGGTNKALTLAAGAVVWTDADSFEVTAAGTSGQCLISGGTGTPTWTSCDNAATTPFTVTSGIIDKTTVGDRLRLLYGDAADVQLTIENTTNATIPTADAAQIDVTGGTTGIVTDGVDVLYLAAEFGNGTTNTNSGLRINIDPVNTPSGDEVFYGINIEGLTAGTSATETAVTIGSNWDTDIAFGDSSVVLDGPASSSITLQDFTTLTASSLTTFTTGATLTISGNLTVQGTTGLSLTGTGADISLSQSETIDNDTDGQITFGRNDLGTVTLTAKDNDATAALTILPGGAAALTLGGSSTTAITLTTDGTGDGEVVLPTGSISGTEILDDTVTLTTDTSGNYVASITAGGGLTGTAASEGSTPTLAVGAGDGITVNADDIAVDSSTTGTTLVTSSNSGIETTTGGVRLLGGCTSGQILKWSAGNTWDCSTDAGSGSGASKWTDSGSITYLTETGDNLAVGGTTSSAPFYIDITNGGNLNLTSTADTENVLALTANSLTTGTGVNITSTSTAGGASGNSFLLDLSRSGANSNTAHTAYGIRSQVTNTNVTSGTNIAAYFSASGATSANYGLIVANGNVGIGDTTPASLFTVGSGDLFQVDSSANTTLQNQADLRLGDADGSNYLAFQAPTTITSNLTWTFPSSNGTSTQCLKTDGTAGTATLSWADCVAAANPTLQDAYNNDTDTGDTIIALTTADDSLIFRNPATSGTDSSYILSLDQLATGAVDVLRVTQAGTGVGASFTFSNVGTTADAIIISNSAGTLTDAIDVSDATGITNAINVGPNDIEGTTATITFTDFTLSADGLITFASDGAGDQITITTPAADFQALVVDGTTNDSTQTAGIIDLNIDTSTNTAVGGLYLTLTDVADNGADTIYGNRTDLTVADDLGASGTDTAYAEYVSLTVTDASSTGYGLYVDAGTGAGTEYAASFNNGNVGIGDTTPDALLEVLGTTEQLRLTYTDGSVDSRFTVSSTGDLTIDSLGGGTTEQLILADADVLNIGGSGSTDVAYNVIGDTTTGASTNVDSDDDLYIEGSLEVDGTTRLDGTLNANGQVNLGDGGDAIAISGTTISLTSNSAGNDISFTSADDFVVNLLDNNADSLDIQQSTNNYININTTDSSENISFGNATTNPSYSFLGTGAVTIAGSADGTDALTLTLGDILVSNGDLDVAGGDFNVTLDAGDSASVTGSSSTSTAGVLDINVTSATANNVGLNVDYTLDSNLLVAGSDFFASKINLNYNDDDSDLFGLVITNNATAAGVGADDVECLLCLDNVENTAGVVSDALRITNSGAIASGITDAIDASDSTIDNALNAGSNFLLFNGIRTFSSSSTVLTIEESTAGGDLLTLTNNASAGDLVATGTISGYGTSLGLNNDASANNVISFGAGPGQPTGDLYWGSRLLCTATSTNCGWATGTTSPFAAQSGIITKNTASDRLQLLYGDVGDVQLEINNTTNLAGAPTADVIQLNLTDGAGITTDNVDGIYVNIEGANGTSTDVSALHLDFDPISGSSDDTFSGLLIDAITGTSATETAINVSTGWDYAAILQGAVGIGTTTPTGQFHVTRPLSYGALGKAVAIFDQIESDDILTASASGTTRFTVSNAGNITLNGGTTITGTSLTSITGGATAIDFTEFDVSASTGSITINDGGDLGNINIEGTVLDINSLDFVGAGSITTAGSNTLTLDAGSNVITFASTDTTLTATGLATITSASTLGISATTLNLGGGAAAIIGTVSDDNLTITPNGSGETTLTSDFDTGVNIGASTNVQAPLSVSGGIGSNAAFILDQLNSGDILSASASGTTRFTVSNAGNITLNGGTTITGTSLTSITGGATAIDFTEFDVSASTGSITINDGGDLGNINIEGTVLDINSLDFTAAGTITSGGTGDITIDAGGSNILLSDALNAGGAAAAAYNFFAASTAGSSIGDGISDLYIQDELEVDGAIRLDNSSITLGDSGFTTCTALETVAGVLTCGSDAGGSSNWRLASGSLSPINDTLDILIGNAATTSAKFAVLNVNSGTPTASVSAGASSAGASYLTAAGTLQTTQNQTLTLGGNTTGDIVLSPRNGSGFVGVNTTTPKSPLDVRGGALTLYDSANGAEVYFNAYSGDKYLTTDSAFAIYHNRTPDNLEFQFASAGTADSAVSFAAGLTLSAAGTISTSGNTIIGDGSGDSLTINAANLSLANASTLNLVNTQTSALNIESGLMNFDTTNSRIGIGTVTPLETLSVVGNATVSGNLTLYGAARTIQTTALNSLTIGGSTTGNIALLPGNSQGNVGIGTSTPIFNLHVASSASNFGAVAYAGAFVEHNSYYGEDFFTPRAQIVANGANNHGDTLSLSTGENGICTWDTLADTANGILSMSVTTTFDSCQSYIADSGGVGNPQLVFDVDNLPLIVMKVRPSVASTGVPDNDHRFHVGISDLGSTAPSVGFPAGGVFFSNCSSTDAATCGTTWNSVTRTGNASGTTTVNSCGVSVSETQFALLVIKVMNSGLVRYYIDGDVSDGVSLSECGNGHTTNIDTTGMTVLLKADFNNGTNASTLDVDFFRVWQDDAPVSNSEIVKSQKPYNVEADADIAESYMTVTGEEYEPATLVSVNEKFRGFVEKTSQGYDEKLIGVVSTSPKGSVILGQGGLGTVQVAVAGRVPVKVNDENGVIKTGDYITSSSTPGVGMKATKAGSVIGKALEDWTIDSGKETVLVQVQNFSYSPVIQFADSGEIQITESADSDGYIALDQNGNIIDAKQAFSDVVSGNITAGRVDAQDILANSLSSNYALFEELTANTFNTNSLNITDGVTTNSLKTSQFSAYDASISGKLKAVDLEASSAAVESLRVNRLIVDTIETTASASALFNLGSQGIKTDFAELDFATIDQDLTVLGTTTLQEASIQNRLSISNIMQIESNSINTVGADLEIQPLKQGNIVFMQGAVTIDTEGNMIVKGNAEFAKDVKVQGTLSATSIKGVNEVLNVSGSARFEKITFSEEEASSSSSSSDLSEISINSSAGKVTLKAGKLEIKVKNNKVTENSLIYITPKTKTYGQTPYIKAQVADDSFTVAIEEAVSSDIEMNFLIVN